MATKEITKREPRYREPELITVSVSDDTRRSFIEALSLLWEKRSHLYRWVAASLLLSMLVAFIIPARYTATTRLMPPDQTSQGLASMFAVLGKSSDLGSLGSELFGIKTSADLFVGVLRSETVENAIINKFDLRKVYHYRRWEDARKYLEGATDVSADRKSGIITIKVNDKSPKRGAEMGREYVEQLNHVVISLDTSAAHRERVFVENRLKEVQADLENAEKDFSQFASKNATLDVKEQSRAMIGAAAQLEGQLIATQTELEGLRQIYTSNNVRVRSLQARIDEYQRQLQKLGGPVQPESDASDNSARSTESPDLYPSIRQLPILGVTWADLYRRTKVEEAVFETLTKQYEIARVDEAREVPSVKVLDVASIPERNSSPPRTLIAICGTGLGLVICIVWILGSAHWQERDSNDPAKKLGEEVVRTIRLKTTHGARRVSRRFRRSADRSSNDES